MSEKNTNCPCTHVGCPRHGDCAACEKNHGAGNTYCKKHKPKV